MKRLTEAKESVLGIKYHPDGQALKENPPRFTWVPSSSKDLHYRLQVSSSEEFKAEETEEFRKLPFNFFAPDRVMEPGTYYWRYSLDEDEECSFSRARRFVIGRDAMETPLPSREDRFAHVDMGHPRIWLNRERIEGFRKELERDRDYCGFNVFYRRSVLEYRDKEFVSEPFPYPGGKRVIPLWRQNYMDCQTGLCHIRALAVAGVLLGDEVLISQAKEGLLTMAAWDTDGPTKRDYNDECAFRVAYALAFGYDWLYDALSEEQRAFVRERLFIRTKQVADHIIVRTRIHYSLYDSHAVRSLSSVIIPCCIVLLGEYEEARQWLDYAIDYLNVVYTPWGGEDGGWAEGAAYWTTAMAFVTEAMNTLKSFTGMDLYQRPFFKKTGDFPLYCNPVDTYRASFCDQSNLGDYPGHKVAFNIRQFAGATGNGNYQWYYDRVMAREPEISQEFYNKGWWDFYFDDMVYRYDYRDCRPCAQAEPLRTAWFRDVGWVAINRDLKEFENHIFFLTKSSPYGSVSHSHGDQNTFVLFAFGEPLIIQSGYYVGFNSSMHRDWRRQTKSQNTILINGQGQYAGMDKVLQLKASGCVEAVEERQDCVYIRENATNAYLEQVPDLENYTREIYFINETCFVMVDTVETGSDSSVDWLLHSLTPFALKGETFFVRRERAELEGRIVYCSSGIEQISQSDEFLGVDPAELTGLEKQYHLDVKTGKAVRHKLVSLLIPQKPGNETLINVIKDDQGMDIYFYFDCDGASFSLKVDGSRKH